MNLKITSTDWNPFDSLGAKYAFILINVDGASRTKLLGIKKTHYEFYDVATKWLQGIESAINDASNIPTDIVLAAKAILYRLYGGMIDDDNYNPTIYDENEEQYVE